MKTNTRYQELLSHHPRLRAVHELQQGPEWAHYIRVFNALVESKRWDKHYRIYEAAIEKAAMPYEEKRKNLF